MSNIEGDKTKSLRFEKGKPAKILAGFDRIVTRYEQLEDKVFGSGSRTQTVNIQTPELRYGIHRRTKGEIVSKELPDGTSRRINSGDIVHLYQTSGEDMPEQLIERKRVKDIFPDAQEVIKLPESISQNHLVVNKTSPQKAVRNLPAFLYLATIPCRGYLSLFV